MNVQEAFLQAYDAHADAIFRHCYYRVYRRELAKDLTQQTFMRVWQYLAQGRAVENMRALLYRTATNLVIDEARKRREAISLDTLAEAGFEPADDPRDRLDGSVDGDRILPYLRQLDDKHRQVLVMRYIDDLAPKEIASILGETANVVSVRLNRAVKQLRSLLPSSYVYPL